MLRGDRVAVLEAREADLEGLDARGARQLARHPFGIRAAFAHVQQRMRALAARREAQDLVDFEVFGRRAQHAAAERLHPRRPAAPAPRGASDPGSSDFLASL